LRIINRLADIGEYYFMSKNDDNFKPKLGRIRSLGNGSGKRYLNRVLNAAGKINPNFGKASGKSLFTGRYIGRGNAKALPLSHQNFRQRRVVIKARFVKFAGAGFRKAVTHLNYVQRDGVSKDGEAGKLYNKTLDDVDGEEFLEQAKDDRHQFRFIVSPEDANELTDMKIFTRDLMAQAEKDLRTKLDWVAADHHNTDNPHTHIIVRGIDEDGRDLVIAKDYLSKGFRERASELMSAELGQRHDFEIEKAMQRETLQDRFTSIDRGLIRKIEDGVIDMRDNKLGQYSKFKRELELSRLTKLKEMGLAKEISTGQWQLSEKIEESLCSLGQRNDIIKTMHAQMARSGKNPIRSNYEILHPKEQPDKGIIGKLVGKGLSDEINDRYYLIVEGVDGKTHYADVGQVSDIEAYKTGSIVELSPQNIEPRKIDYTIAKIANANKELYSEELHKQHDPKASREYIKTHIRRLEALRRNNIARRFIDGSWEVPRNYINEVSQLTKTRAKQSPIKITIRSQFSLEVQTSATGATWLDRSLIDNSKTPLSNVGFGGEVKNALNIRQAYLLAEGFAKETDTGTIYQKGILKNLEQREVNKKAASISKEIGKTFKQTQKGDKIEGVYSKPVELASGKYALIEKSKEFRLVPWRAVLERTRGQAISGTMGGNGISWNIGKKRGIGIS